MTALAATRRFRIMMAFFIVGLLISGITAFPLLAEMKLLASWLGLGDAVSPEGHTGLNFWILTVRFGLEDMYARYPWIAYGTDWLAFGHITIALFFIGPFLRPAEGRSVILAGIAACILVIPLALICGPIRGIPVYWRLIDCSFGVFGVFPLLYCLRLLRYIVPKQSPQPTAPSDRADLTRLGLVLTESLPNDSCPKCGGEMHQTDKNTFTGEVWREFTCGSCGNIVAVNEGKALWQILHDEAMKTK